MRLRLFMEGTGIANRAAFEVFRLLGLGADAVLPARRALRRAERGFDREADIDTLGRVPCAARDLADRASVGDAWHYAGVDPRVLREALAAIPGAPQAFHFVDYGSGKGRAMAVAALHGFGAVTGIEFAPSLHRCAVANGERLRRRHPGAPWNARLGDAIGFDLPRGSLVVHLYNPFRGVVFESVMRRLADAAAERADPVFIVYCNPLYEEVLRRIVPVADIASGDGWRVFRAIPKH